MFLYTHMALAHKLTERIQVEELGDYLLGSVFPDVRYFLHRDRKWTHIPIEEVDHIGGLSHELSFEIGYKVHLAIDQLCAEKKIISAIRECLPWYVRKRISDILVNTIPDVYYMRRYRFKIVPPQKYEFTLTKYLGIEASFVVSLYRMCEDFFKKPTPKRGIELLERSHLLTGRRTRIIKTIGLAALHIPGVEAIIMERIRKVIVGFEQQVLNDIPALLFALKPDDK